MERWTQKLEALKQARSPTPLASYLHIYEATAALSYRDYMQGAKALAAYLQPLELEPATSAVPRIHRSYELYELAKAIRPHTSIPHTIQEIESAIYAYHAQLR